jgi:dihydroorotate dehydrogenase (NAD+) catalytic subunit
MKMKNPVMTASGTFGYGEEYSEFVDLNSLGAVVVKGISLKPREGNPPPRIWETPCGMLNSIGLQNVGLERFLKSKLPFLRQFDTNVVVNILGETVEEYVQLCEALDAVVEAIELNLSCPNVKRGGILFSEDPELFRKVIGESRKKINSSVMIVKLSPVSDVREFARIAEQEGADALSLINTIPAMAIDIHTRRPRLSNLVGGLSGPAIKPVGVKMVWDVFRTVGIPIIGMGGIMTGEDAVEYILAGATAIAVGTANFVYPDATRRVLHGIEEYMRLYNIEDINSLIGGLIWEG